jgi:hypothetical protein
MTMMILTLTLTLSGLAQIPNPSAAIGAAKNAKTQTEAAQQKNAEALDQAKTPPAAAPGAPTPSAPKGDQPPPAQGAGYSYDPAGRRDPFVSLTGRGGDVPIPGGARPSGPAGLLVNEITVKGVLKSPKGGFIALVQSPDNRTYIVHSGDKVFDGSVKAITQDAVVFSQDVNDPLSLVKQREVRKAIRPEAR